MRRLIYLLPALIVLINVFGCNPSKSETARDKNAVRGWNILSDDVDKGIIAVKAAKEYNINHLQLSHHLIHNLKDVRDPERLAKTRHLVEAATVQGIKNILVWDHALYDLDYYPDDYKNEDGLINLDNPKFWMWFKKDYRSMLDSLIGINGIVLTFIETGAHLEDQHSDIWKTESEKLANLVDSVASVVIDERGFDLFVRTFIYTEQELESMLGCINLIKHPGVKVMTKEVPHDFFLTHPVSKFIEKFNKDVLIEFDLGHEFNGQGVIASILPETTVKRWKYYSSQKNVIGYVARTDRYHNTQNIGRPTEINLFALRRVSEDTSLSAETIVEEFIARKYGKKLIPHLKDVFLETDDIITSVLYTLGLHTNNHSRFDLDYSSNYSRHCSGKWLSPPVVSVAHDVNREFHYWKDIVEILSPAKYKRAADTDGNPSKLYSEVPWVVDSAWVSPVEKMNRDYLLYILQEKEYGLTKTEWALDKIRKAEPYFSSKTDYEDLLHLFERTLLTAELYLHGAKVYFGKRCKRAAFADESIDSLIREGQEGLKSTCSRIRAYPHPGPQGQYHWEEDADRAEELID